MSEYIVLEAGEWPALSDNVEDKIAEGWQCQGGVSVAVLGNDDYLYSQAMIRITPTEKAEK